MKAGMTTEEKRRAYYSIPSAVRKESDEMKVFMEFVAAARLNVDSGSPENAKPPLPDIRCSVGGKPYLFELGEITDEDLAAEIGRSLRTCTDGEGGCLSEEEPLIRMILKKAGSTYKTDGVPLNLVLHYDRQYPFGPAQYLDRHEGEIAIALVPSGPFSRIWIYDGWNKVILWSRG
jgi:hypothetical protein